MADTPWKTKDWFVSEWNYADEVTKDFKFAKNVKVHDITLRDGEQQTGIIMTLDDKIRICLLYTSPSPRDRQKSRMPSSA